MKLTTIIDHKYISFTKTEQDERITIPLFGKFAAVQESPSAVQLAADRIRSVPLFYSIDTGGGIFIADDAAKIAEKRHLSTDKDCEREFLCTGYVTGNRSLFQGVFTVRPGEIVTIRKGDGNIRREQYFSLDYRCDGTRSEAEYIEAFDQCLTEVFSDLIARLDGRTVVIPLSGGCDSRTVAVMLKRLGYKNVICFSYGRQGNAESARSKAVADALGYRWLFAEYTGEKWKRFYESDDYRNFLAFSCRGSGIGCVQALPAILELKRAGKVPEDAVVVPGHALDFNAGSHLAPANGNITRKSMVRRIVAGHYTLRRLTGDDRRYFMRCNPDIPVRMSEASAVGVYQRWEWVNRQSKFIANDVRAYEFAGLDWELPFWDERVCRFWAEVPARLLYGRRLQYAYTVAKIDPMSAQLVAYPSAGGTASSVPAWVKACAKIVLRPVLSIRTRRLRLADYETNSNDFYGFMSRKEFEGMLKRYGNGWILNTKIAEDTLNIYSSIN